MLSPHLVPDVFIRHIALALIARLLQIERFVNVEVPHVIRALTPPVERTHMHFKSCFNKSVLKLSLATVFTLAGAGFSGYSFAADATATASGTVIAPIAIAKATDLSFGKFARGAGGTITVSTSGARTASGVILSSIGSSPAAARFNVTGDANATYSITHSGSASLTNTTGTGGETMTLTKYSDLAADNATSGNVTSGVLNASGAQSIYVGGTLNVAAAQVAGVYSGNVIVTVEYN